MALSTVAKMHNPVVYRNYYKMRLTKNEINFWYIRVVCFKCQGGVVRTGEDRYGCRECGEVRASLDGWLMVGCYDQTGYCQIKVDNHLMLPYLGLEE